MYSNLGYILLGHLLEQVSGQSYAAVINENIISKLPVKAGELTFEIVNPANMAKGYHKQLTFSNLILGLFINKSKFMTNVEGGWRAFKAYYVNGLPYGGLIGTPRAFMVYLQHLMATDSLLLSNQFKSIFFQENLLNSGKSTGMGLSWYTGQLNGNPFVCHAGGGGGYYCEIRLYPEKNIGSVIFLNRTGMSDERLLDKIDKFYF